MEQIPENLDAQNTPEESKDSSYRRLKQAVDYLQETTIKTIELEKNNALLDMPGWNIYDAPLNWGESEDNQPVGFNQFFAKVLEGQKIEEYLNKTYGNRPINIAEFGGPFRSASRQIAGKVRVNASLGLTMADVRTTQGKWNDAEDDHSVVEGDMFLKNFKKTKDGETYSGLSEVHKWIDKNGKIDFLVVRMLAPLLSFIQKKDGEYPAFILKRLEGFDNKISDIDAMKYVFFRSLTRWYETLSEDGTMLVELPGDCTKEIELLSEKFVDEKGNKFFDIKAETYGEKERFNVLDLRNLADPEFVKRLPDIPKTLMRLRRLPGSPDSLSIDDLIEKLK